MYLAPSLRSPEFEDDDENEAPRRLAQSLATLCPRILAVLMQNHGHNFAAGITFEIELGIDNLVEKFVFGAGVNRGGWLPGEPGFKMVAF